MGTALSRRNNDDSHLLGMWSAITNYDDEALLDSLRHRRLEKLKFSIRACLLHSSIIRGNLGAVRLILESGFDLQKAARNGFFPLSTAAEYSVFRPVDETHSTCCETIRLLLDHGAQMTYPNEPNKSNPLKYIHRIAVQAPDAADLLFEKMTPDEMNGLCCDPGVSPLSACFLYVCFYYKNGGLSETTNLKAVFCSAILPLLRFGARFGPDVFHKAWLSSRLCIAAAELNADCSSVLWGYPNAVASLLVATLQRGDFDPSRFSHLKSSEFTSKYISGCAVSQFVGSIGSHFPLSLQSLCRIVILRNLPLGHQRVKSIEKFDLPKPLEGFLNFKEFELS